MPSKKLSDFSNVTIEQVLEIILAAVPGTNLNDSIVVVAKRVLEIPDYCCAINIADDEGINEFIVKWTQKFIRGWENRPSQRTSKPISTQHDPILDDIIAARLPGMTDDLEAIRYGHRLSMSAENIAGSLLEEYVADNLFKFGWHCCWGDTMRSIDFCNVDGQLLQIKNSDNSENSSSKTVRDGTEIKHWFRRFSKTGATNWPALNKIAGISDENDELSEEKFKVFVKEVVSNNPGSLFLERDSPWYGVNQKSES